LLGKSPLKVVTENAAAFFYYPVYFVTIKKNGNNGNKMVTKSCSDFIPRSDGILKSKLLKKVPYNIKIGPKKV
jgi:hypothetical protein